MEKVEKILLLIVLGVAMTIVAVMSFQSGGKTDPKKGTQGTLDNRVSNAPPADSNKSLSDLITDGPELDKQETTPKSVGSDDGSRKAVLSDKDELHTRAELSKGQEDPQNSKKTDDSASVAPAFLDFVKDPSGPGLLYIVRKDDTFSEIVARYCGTAASAVQDRILKLNEGMDLDHIRQGDKIFFPADLVKNLSAGRTEGAGATRKKKALSKSEPGSKVEITPTSSSSYRIQQGDTLWDLAVSKVGKSQADAYVKKIQKLNPSLDPLHLIAGRSIVLPD